VGGVLGCGALKCAARSRMKTEHVERVGEGGVSLGSSGAIDACDSKDGMEVSRMPAILACMCVPLTPTAHVLF
jgi:hypothetical protein